MFQILKRGANLFALTAKPFNQMVEAFALLSVASEQVYHVNEFRAKYDGCVVRCVEESELL